MVDAYSSQIENAKKTLRVIDQTASMHFTLSDTYKRYSKFEDILEILISVILCGLTFLDYEKYFGLPANTSILLVGFLSIFLFAYTLIKQALGHKELYERHLLAGKMYVKIKRELRTKIKRWESGEVEDILGVLDNLTGALEDLIQIPEKKFAKLKHQHQAKVAFSKFLDDNPHKFWLVCRWKFRMKNKK